MSGYIKQISVTNFKSIKLLEKFTLNNINILIGANGAGKSNFVKLFKFLQNMVRNGVRAKVDVTLDGGVDSILTYGRKMNRYMACDMVFKDGEVEFDFGFNLESIDSDTFKLSIFRLDNHLSDQEYADIIAKKMSKLQIFHFHDTGNTSPIKSTVGMHDTMYLRGDGQNIMAMVIHIYYAHRSHYNAILDTIRLAVPDFKDFVIPDYYHHNPNGDVLSDYKRLADRVRLFWESKYNPEIPLRGDYLSDGSLRYICLVVLLLMPVELLPDTIIIDEPELGLHPDALSIIAALIHQLSAKKQFIISTQSPDFINYFEANDIIVVDKNNIDGTSDFKHLSKPDIALWLKNYKMAELWDMNIIGGRP